MLIFFKGPRTILEFVRHEEKVICKLQRNFVAPVSSHKKEAFTIEHVVHLM